MKFLRLRKISPKEIPGYVKTGIGALSRDIRQMRGTNVWIFIMYGLLFDMVNNLWRPFSVKFLERLGGTELEISLLSALPGAVAAIVLLPGAILFRRFTDKKRATAAFILISRAMLLGIAFVPILPPRLQPILFVVFVAIMNCPDALSQTSLQSLLGDVFHGNTRGQAIALRTKFGQAVIPVVTIASGLAITFIPRDDYQRMFLYQIFFVGAFLLGVVEVFIFNRLKVPNAPTPAEYATTSHNLADIKKILKDKRFLAFFVPAIFFLFTWQSGWPLVNIFQVMHLRATEMWFAIFALTSGLASLLSGTFWQRFLSRRGNNATFVASASLLTLNMFVMPFVPNVQVMALVFVVTGVSAIGINTALLNGVLEASPDENRLMYLAFYNTAQNISLFIAPFFAVALLSFVEISYAMLVIGVLRILSTLFVWLNHKLRREREQV